MGSKHWPWSSSNIIFLFLIVCVSGAADHDSVPQGQQNTTAETTKCEWKGSTYLEGEKFYPDEEPCKTCICKKGFDGTLNGPWCKQATCGIELHYTNYLARGCAPVFYKSTCCPIEWRCREYSRRNKQERNLNALIITAAL